MTPSQEESKEGRSAAPSAAPARRGWWREVLYALAFYLVYSYIRNHFGSAAVSPDEALANARKVIDVERFLGLYHEPTIQGWFVHATGNGLAFGFAGARALMQLWNVLYGTLHFVVTAGALVWLYRRFGSDYPLWRNTLAFTTGLALLVYGLYPLMPPRLLPDCGTYGACLSQYPYVDSLATIGGLWSFDSGTMQSISNQYAAMPSLHFAWASWAFLALRPRLVHRWSRVAITVYPWLTLWVIVVTANHFWLDAAGGAAVLALGYAAARAVEAGWARFGTSPSDPGEIGAGASL
jgi:hypothetical protein